LLLGHCALMATILPGCGTTRSTYSSRTATEQLLVSDAIDRAVGDVSFHALAGQSVFLDTTALQPVLDKEYLGSSLRQHLLASGCVLRESRDKADFVVEARAGVVGTDNHSLLFGIPAMQVPQILPLQGMVPSAIPEVPFAKRQEQRAMAKIAVFAYHRETGMSVWQSGISVRDSTSKDTWVLGAGPFQRGTIHDEPSFAGTAIKNPLMAHEETNQERPKVGIGAEASFAAPNLFAETPEPYQAPADAPPVSQATHQQAP
jgi:hypothetical protein